MEGIELARPEDVTQLSALAYKLYNELEDLEDVQPDFIKISTEVLDLVTNHAVLTVRNKKNDKLIDGFIALKYSAPWWSNERVLSSVLFYVKPEHRNGKTFKKLLNGVKEYAIIVDMKVFLDISGSSFESRGRLIRRNKFRPYGGYYMYKPPSDKIIET